ncbi:MAG: hypothetical protein Ct9H300mP14_16080 [Gammaproteobacteria bacterium]|nr:MAG: hypothetical protein Ct9H300mP14_16080 [Gammaproteobacteria bacterium]
MWESIVSMGERKKRLVGDVEFARPVRGGFKFTPVPVEWAMTIACLLRNTFQAACPEMESIYSGIEIYLNS